MLFKIPMRNIRRSMRDYAIYFFTLIIGVSIFYVFNAITGQAAMLRVAQSNNSIIVLLKTSLSGVSVFVAVVLALLIVYASRFLMKRRNKEFALYMMLGMSKGRISAILLAETIFIGLGSLVVGLFLGVLLSQLMSALVANLFEADMTAYKLSISWSAAGLTVLYFTIMYLAVMLLNSFAVAKMKLIDLMMSGKKSEQIKLRNPIVCVMVFLLSVAGLAYAYYQVAFDYEGLDQKLLFMSIIIGAVTTFTIFWSVSGMLLRIVMSAKKLYFKNLNAFTFRQISSKVNTMVLSMTVICLMLFVTICTLSAAFSVRNSINNNLKTLCPVDYQAEYVIYDAKNKISAEELFAKFGYDINEGASEHVTVNTYYDDAFTMADAFGDYLPEVLKQFRMLNVDASEVIIGVSDYNNLMRLYGRDEISINEDEFVCVCDYATMKSLRDAALKIDRDITVCGRNLHAKYDKCVDSFLEIGAQHINDGLFVVPDDVAVLGEPLSNIYSANFAAAEKEELEALSARFNDTCESVTECMKDMGKGKGYIKYNTKVEVYDSARGLGAILAFLGLYIGLVFLIASGAILSLKELSESVDSIGRYEMLRKIGANEGDINRSVFVQALVFFSLPLILAIIHSVFGMKFAVRVLDVFGTEGIARSVSITGLILLAIYGGYFIITYFNSKWIVSSNK